MPLYHKTSVTVHAHPDLGVDGRLGAYECVDPGWQLNVLLTHVRFGEETKDFPNALSLAYRRLSLLAPTIVIGDLNAAPTNDDRTGPPTATDIAVWDALTLKQLLHEIWTTKKELATLLRPSTPEAQDRDAHLHVLLTTRRHHLQEWHAHRIAAAAQEREGYGRNYTPYKSLRYVSHVLEDTGLCTIHAVRIPEGGLTNNTTTRGRPPRAPPPYQRHHPRTCAQGLQPETATHH